MNALAFAARHGLDEDEVIAALLHASRLGLFEMSWNILCPSCSGVLGANTTLKTVRQASYHCAFCALDREPVLDNTVEVSFAVSPRIRRIPVHDPGSLSFWDYHRQVFFGSGVSCRTRLPSMSSPIGSCWRRSSSNPASACSCRCSLPTSR